MNAFVDARALPADNFEVELCARVEEVLAPHGFFEDEADVEHFGRNLAPDLDDLLEEALVPLERRNVLEKFEELDLCCANAAVLEILVKDDCENLLVRHHAHKQRNIVLEKVNANNGC